MNPQCRIKIDGVMASGVMMDRLISCAVTDKEGINADSVQITLNNSPAAQIPRKGAKIQVWMGYGDQQLTFMGTFVVDEVEVTLFPHTMNITGKSADLREKMKENKERHWDDKTVAKIVSDIAADHGLSAKVDSAVGQHKYTWLGQQDESDIHFLRRLERRHGALFSIKDGTLIFAKRGAGTKPSGGALSGFTVSQTNIIEGSGRVRFSDRAEYKQVAAYHQDRDKVERVEVTAPSSADGSATYRIGTPFADPDEATKAVKSKAEELKRQAIKFSCSVFGDPAARAGAPLQFSGMEAGIDGIEFIIETAKHAWSKSGYTTSLDGKLKI